MKTPDVQCPSNVQLVAGDSAHDAASMLAEKVAGVLVDRLKDPGRASLAVSGGSTPIAFFELLAQKPIDWSRVDVVLADERCVPETDPASNSALVKRYLLQGPAASAQYRPLWAARGPGARGGIAADGVVAAEAELADLEWPLTALVLGMGNDGHTASLFPDAPELYEALDVRRPAMVAAMTPPSQAQQRLTLTLRALGGARFKALLVKGMDKAETLRRACERLDDVEEMPVRVFLRLPLVVYWSADLTQEGL